MELNDITSFLLFVAILVGTWLLGFILRRLILRLKIRPETINLVKLLILLLQVVIIGLGASWLYDIQTNAILGLSALFGTSIGFALALVTGNIVGGLYLIAVRPFGIGDLIQVKGTTAIVLEIGLNYTRLLQIDGTILRIPNKSLLDANVVICSLKVGDIQDRAQQGLAIGFKSLIEDLEETGSTSSTFSRVGDLIGEVLSDKEIVRYPLTVEIPKNSIAPGTKASVVYERMEELVDRWEQKFGYRPKFYFSKYVFRMYTTVVIIADTPRHIFNELPRFLEDLYKTVFKEKHEEVVN